MAINFCLLFFFYFLQLSKSKGLPSKDSKSYSIKLQKPNINRVICSSNLNKLLILAEYEKGYEFTGEKEIKVNFETSVPNKKATCFLKKGREVNCYIDNRVGAEPITIKKAENSIISEEGGIEIKLENDITFDIPDKCFNKLKPRKKNNLRGTRILEDEEAALIAHKIVDFNLAGDKANFKILVILKNNFEKKDLDIILGEEMNSIEVKDKVAFYNQFQNKKITGKGKRKLAGEGKCTFDLSIPDTTIADETFAYLICSATVDTSWTQIFVKELKGDNIDYNEIKIVDLSKPIITDNDLQKYVNSICVFKVSEIETKKTLLTTEIAGRVNIDIKGEMTCKSSSSTVQNAILEIYNINNEETITTNCKCSKSDIECTVEIGSDGVGRIFPQVTESGLYLQLEADPENEKNIIKLEEESSSDDDDESSDDDDSSTKSSDDKKIGKGAGGGAAGGGIMALSAVAAALYPKKPKDFQEEPQVQQPQKDPADVSIGTEAHVDISGAGPSIAQG